MTEETKQGIQIVLEMLRKELTEQHVSMGYNGTKKTLVFFDTDTYIAEKRFDGFEVSIESLVK